MLRVVINNMERFRIDSNGKIITNNVWGIGTGQTTSQYVALANNGGTTRYKYLDLTGIGTTWTHTTSAP